MLLALVLEDFDLPNGSGGGIPLMLFTWLAEAHAHDRW